MQQLVSLLHKLHPSNNRRLFPENMGKRERVQLSPRVRGDRDGYAKRPKKLHSARSSVSSAFRFLLRLPSSSVALSAKKQEEDGEGDTSDETRETISEEESDKEEDTKSEEEGELLKDQETRNNLEKANIREENRQFSGLVMGLLVDAQYGREWYVNNQFCIVFPEANDFTYGAILVPWFPNKKPDWNSNEKQEVLDRLKSTALLIAEALEMHPEWKGTRGDYLAICIAVAQYMEEFTVTFPIKREPIAQELFHASVRVGYEYSKLLKDIMTYDPNQQVAAA